jgi:serine protease AprX
MYASLVPRSRGLEWRLRHGILLLVGLLVPLIVMTPASHSIPRVQPELLELASHRPHSMVQVIVQMLANNEDVEGTVMRLGGRVTRHLDLIDALAAELPARAVPLLARSAGVRWVSLDAVVEERGCGGCFDASRLESAYIQTIGADRLWAEGLQRKSPSFSVAVVDSGMANSDDLSRNKQGGKTRVVAEYNVTTDSIDDEYGHGSHIAGIVGGNGAGSKGAYVGVAPRINLVNVKVSDARGMATTADVVAGLQWIFENRDTYNIRVVNLSLNSSVPESYHTSPLDAAVEVLWFNKIVVVVSAGNTDRSTEITPPANDPFVITVGAADDRGTPDPSDDTLASFSAYGTTSDGVAKPDLVAPGRNIVSLLASADDVLATEHPDHVVPTGKRDYFRMSGTSMAAPVVAGAVALLLEDEPGLTPGQVKYRLMATARAMAERGTGAGELDVYAAVKGTTTESADEGIALSRLLWNSGEPVVYSSANWGSANWGSANWGSANWGSANWGSANWGSANWGSTYWEP